MVKTNGIRCKIMPGILGYRKTCFVMLQTFQPPGYWAKKSAQKWVLLPGEQQGVVFYPSHCPHRSLFQSYHCQLVLFRRLSVISGVPAVVVALPTVIAPTETGMLSTTTTTTATTTRALEIADVPVPATEGTDPATSSNAAALTPWQPTTEVCQGAICSPSLPLGRGESKRRTVGCWRSEGPSEALPITTQVLHVALQTIQLQRISSLNEEHFCCRSTFLWWTQHLFCTIDSMQVSMSVCNMTNVTFFHGLNVLDLVGVLQVSWLILKIIFFPSHRSHLVFSSVFSQQNSHGQRLTSAYPPIGLLWLRYPSFCNQQHTGELYA